MTLTDQSLKQALANMLPEKLTFEFGILFWKHIAISPSESINPEVKYRELLQICWEIEEGLKNEAPNYSNKRVYYKLLEDTYGTYGSSHATWQQRCIALAQIKGIEII